MFRWNGNVLRIELLSGYDEHWNPHGLHYCGSVCPAAEVSVYVSMYLPSCMLREGELSSWCPVSIDFCMFMNQVLLYVVTVGEFTCIYLIYVTYECVFLPCCIMVYNIMWDISKVLWWFCYRYTDNDHDNDRSEYTLLNTAWVHYKLIVSLASLAASMFCLLVSCTVISVITYLASVLHLLSSFLYVLLFQWLPTSLSFVNLLLTSTLPCFCLTSLFIDILYTLVM